MLMLTSQAATEIRQLVDQPGLAETAGLRIASDPSGSLTLSLAAVPAEDDAVVDASGARVFLDQQAARTLDDKTLDATTDSGGRVQFAIAQQGT